MATRRSRARQIRLDRPSRSRAIPAHQRARCGYGMRRAPRRRVASHGIVGRTFAMHPYESCCPSHLASAGTTHVASGPNDSRARISAARERHHHDRCPYALLHLAKLPPVASTAHESPPAPRPPMPSRYTATWTRRRRRRPPASGVMDQAVGRPVTCSADCTRCIHATDVLHAYTSTSTKQTPCMRRAAISPQAVRRIGGCKQCCLAACVSSCIQPRRPPPLSTSKIAHRRATQPNASRPRQGWHLATPVFNPPHPRQPHSLRLTTSEFDNPSVLCLHPPVRTDALKLFESSLTFPPRKVCEFESFQSSQLPMNVASH